VPDRLISGNTGKPTLTNLGGILATTDFGSGKSERKNSLDLSRRKKGKGFGSDGSNLVRNYKGPLKGSGDRPPVTVRTNCLKLKNCH
jgi:hypothetical protein